jgi:hypothetical protein
MMYEWDRRSIKKFVIDLNVPPNKRWNKILDDPILREHLLALMNNLGSLFSDINEPPPPGFKNRDDFFKQLSSNLFLQLKNLNAYYLVDEMKGIANHLNIPVWDVALLHLLYEAEGGGCTSIIMTSDDDKSNSKTNSPIFGRVLDWDFSELLAPLTVEITLVRNSKVVLEGLTFCGFVGLLTARRPSVCAAAVHFRRSNDSSDLSTSPSPSNPAWPVAFLVRHVLQAPNLETFEEVKSLLSHSPLWAPCFIVMTGNNMEQCLVIRRDNTTFKIRKMNPLENVMIQTNVDHIIDCKQQKKGEEVEDFMFSHQRDSTIKKYLLNVKDNTQTNKEKLWNVMSVSPVLDEASVHCCVFGACTPISSGVTSINIEYRDEKRKREVKALWKGNIALVLGMVLFCVAVSFFLKWRHTL